MVQSLKICYPAFTNGLMSRDTVKQDVTISFFINSISKGKLRLIQKSLKIHLIYWNKIQIKIVSIYISNFQIFTKQPLLYMYTYIEYSGIVLIL